MDSLRKKNRFFVYTDKKKNKDYIFGQIEQIYGVPVFRKVDVNEKIIVIEGITTTHGNVTDTTDWGFCCFEVFVAKCKAETDSSGTFYDIRHFGKTNNVDTDSTKKVGFFSIKANADFNDVLVIGNPGGAGSGTLIYKIGELLKKDF